MAFHAVVLPVLVFYFALHVAPWHQVFLTQLFAGGIAAGSGIAVISSVGYGMLADVQTGRLSLLCASGGGKASYFSAHLISALLLSLLSIAFSLVLLVELDAISIDASRLSGAICSSAIAVSELAERSDWESRNRRIPRDQCFSPWKQICPSRVPFGCSSAHPSPEASSISSWPDQVNSTMPTELFKPLR
jgi:hypothetical protein